MGRLVVQIIKVLFFQTRHEVRKQDRRGEEPSIRKGFRESLFKLFSFIIIVFVILFIILFLQIEVFN